MSTVSPPAISAKLESEARNRLKHLSVLPAVALQALEVAQDPSCTLHDFTAMVERDVRLAADLLSTANSVMFSNGKPVSTLQQAVVRLGVRRCRNLLLTASMSALSQKLPLQQEWVRECLTRHGFLTAILALHINRISELGFQGEEFAAGLVHDLGRSLLSVVFPSDFDAIDSLHFDESTGVLMSEQQACGTDHCEFGSWFAMQHRFPEDLVHVIRYHHEPMRSDRHRKLVALIAVCDHMANYLQRFEYAEGYVVAGNSAVPVLDACLTQKTLHRVTDSAMDLMKMSMKDAMEMMAS